MDITALGVVLIVALGLLGHDTIRRADVVITAPSFTSSARATLDQPTLEREFGAELRSIAETPVRVRRRQHESRCRAG
jgi:hypothetical protein